MEMIGVYVLVYSVIITLPLVGFLWLAVETGYKVLFGFLAVLWLTATLSAPIIALQG